VSACISALQHLRKLRGGSQSHLLQGSDGAWYVTKFQNNPQHVRVLANEMLATRLGLALGLPMPRVETIAVSDWLIEHTEDLRIDLGAERFRAEAVSNWGRSMEGLTVPAERWTTYLVTCLKKFSTSMTLLGFLSWTNGRATATGGRHHSAARHREVSASPQHLSTRATASMPGSGRSLTIH
jgi:hypothetical protein